MYLKNKFLKIKRISSLFFYFLLFFSANVIVLRGQGTGDPPAMNQKLKNPIPNINSIDGFIKIVLEGIITIGVPVVAFAIIYSGFLFITAQGKSDKITTAKNSLLYSIIGAVLLLGAWSITKIIEQSVLNLR